MRKKIIALFLLTLALFHSLVLTPRANALVFEASVARQAFMAASPYAVLAIAAGYAMVMAIERQTGTDIFVLGSQAVTSLKNWWNAKYGVGSTPPDTGYNWTGTINNRTVQIWGSGTPGRFNCTINGQQYVGNGIWQDVLDAIRLYAGPWTYPGTPPPTTATDYAGDLENNPPSFPVGSMKGSPGAAARIASGAKDYGIKVSYMTDAEVGALLDTFNGKNVAADGTESAPTTPEVNDNTMTAGAAQQIGLLGEIKNYVWNLLGIQTDTRRIANSMDNGVAILQQISGKLDNTGGSTFPTAAQNALDNIGINTNTTAQKISELDNTITAPVSTGAVSTVSAKLQSIKDLLLTKFPFSLIALVPAITTADTGTSPDLVVHMGNNSMDVSPWKSGPLSTLLSIIKGLLAVAIWAGCSVAIYRRVTLGED